MTGFNVLMLSAWYPTEKNPFLGIFVRRHAESIALMHNVFLLHVALDEDMKEGEFRIQKKQNEKLTELIIYYGKSKRKSNLINAFRNYKLLQKHYQFGLNKLLTLDIKFDLIHLNIAWPLGLITRSFSRQINTPIVLSEHWTGYLPEDGRYRGVFLKYVTKAIVEKARAISTVSSHLSKQMTLLGLKGKYLKISNVVDTDIFDIGKNENEVEKIVFLHVSSLDDAQKNVSGLLKAFQKIKKKHTNTELIIVGAGANEQAIKRLSNELGLTTRGVTFLGQKSGLELAEIYHKADVFILNSLYENQPVVILEALSCGLPVISSNVGGINEVINTENGILFKPNDENELLKAVEFFIENYSKYNKQSIRDFAIKYFSKNVISEEFNQLYNSILNK
jgi:glycosyltransferase involved in cell wall biosynthesis